MAVRLDKAPDHPDKPDNPSHRNRSTVGQDETLHPLTPQEATLDERVRAGRLRWNGQDWETRPTPGERAAHMRDKVHLHPEIENKPLARDIIPGIDRAVMDPRKLYEYSMRPDHPQNRNKHQAWRTVGYDVDNPFARREAARDLQPLIRDGLLPQGHVTRIREYDDGSVNYKVKSAFIGPNDKHGTLVTGWKLPTAQDHNQPRPRLITVWLEPHPNHDDKRQTP